MVLGYASIMYFINMEKGMKFLSVTCNSINFEDMRTGATYIRTPFSLAKLQAQQPVSILIFPVKFYDDVYHRQNEP